LKKHLSIYFFIVCLALLSIAELKEHLVDKSDQRVIASATEHLQKLEGQMQKSLDDILQFKSEQEFHEYFIHHGFQNMGFSFFFYQNGKLDKWSDNETEILSPDSLQLFSLLHSANGWYEAFSKTSGEKKAIGLLLIKKEYAIENNYLQNRFNKKLGLPETAHLADDGGAYRIQSSSGRDLFSVSFSEETTEPENFSINGWLELFAYLFFLFAIFFFFFLKKNLRAVHIAIAAAILFLVRLFMIMQHLPGEFYSSSFFSPKYYGSSFFFNSTGDLLLNAIAFFCFAALVYTFSAKRIARANFRHGMLITVLAAMMLFMVLIHNLIAGLIINSKISFDAASMFNLNGYSVAAIVSIMLLLWSCFFLLYSVLLSFQSVLEKRNEFFVSLFAAIVIQFIILYVLHFIKPDIQFFQPFALVFSLALILSTAHIIGRKMKVGSNISVAYVLLFSLYASATVTNYQAEKEREARKLFAQRLDSRQDHIAEYLFEDEEKKISNDSVIRSLFISDKKVTEGVSKHLQQFYFNGYLNKFNVTATCYDKTGMPYEPTVPTLEYYRQKADSQGRSTYCDKLFFMMNESGRLSYLALLPVENYPDTDAHLGTIVLRLEAKLMQPAEGLPDLLVSNRIRSYEAEANYSFARYNQGSLIYAYGNFPYSFSSAPFREAKNDFTFLQNEDYDHLIYHASPSALIIVSKPAESSFTALSLFSYILFFFSIIFFAAYFAILLAQKRIRYPFNLKQRIRSSILALVLFSFVLIAAGTIYYITHKYEQDVNKNILSQLNSLWFSLNDSMNLENNLSVVNKEQSQSSLNDLVNNLSLDFNLYDESGNLFYSSQPKIFEKGLISARMNPEALFEMDQNERTQFVHPENIGKLKYISAYSPLTSHAGNITGYVNLPFLEKQNELNKEISDFLSALITIYMLLLALAVFIALVISSRITQPLLLIQNKLSNINLGSRNESIEWKRNDEIGALVHEYNRMIDELAISAEKLSRSERESAWREMAKQIAHEIKNPLTPMKLQLQQLQRALKDDMSTEKLKENVERINKMLIEQIDNLSNIASEFSNFANMPRTENETLNLAEVLSSAIFLFSGSPGITILFNDDGSDRKVFADRGQLLRLFSNLIKNAIQSIPEGKEGRIEINVETSGGFHIASVQDNGTGIAAEQRSKIFTPNFTTKTSGMGLGLAIVKNTAEQAGGKVWFETKENEGTTFFVQLPAMETDVA